MPIIQVDCWEGFTEDQKKAWAQELTAVTVNRFSIPADKVLVILRESPLANWTQGGVVANDPDFLDKSRSATLQSAT
ncbi:4-oxalocrotonate tautomerase family protein [Cohnella faecalis]|nr:tautomerase family protein [Cohnella faecalis]